jgi:hypothetical protein
MPFALVSRSRYQAWAEKIRCFPGWSIPFFSYFRVVKTGENVPAE